MFVVTSLNKTKSCSFFFLQFIYNKLKKNYIFLYYFGPLSNNPSSAPDCFNGVSKKNWFGLRSYKKYKECFYWG